MSQSFVERDHSFRKYAKFPKNQHFLPPDTLTCQFLGEFCIRTKWMIQKHYQWNSNEFFDTWFSVPPMLKKLWPIPEKLMLVSFAVNLAFQAYENYYNYTYTYIEKNKYFV